MKKWLLLLFVPMCLSAQNVTSLFVTNVYDGDTIHGTNVTGQVCSVRLYGIDAPELEQPYGTNAKMVLSNYVMNKTVEIIFMGKDPFGRIIGVIKWNQSNINMLMIVEGMAWYYDIGNKDLNLAYAFRTFQYEAKIGKVGLWADKNPISPFQYRSGNFAKWNKKK